MTISSSLQRNSYAVTSDSPRYSCPITLIRVHPICLVPATLSRFLSAPLSLWFLPLAFPSITCNYLVNAHFPIRPTLSGLTASLAQQWGLWFQSRTSWDRSSIESYLIPEQDILGSLLHWVTSDSRAGHPGIAPTLSHIWFQSRTSWNHSYIESYLIPEQDILESLLHWVTSDSRAGHPGIAPTLSRIWFQSRTSWNRSYIESYLIPEQDIPESLLHWVTSDSRAGHPGIAPTLSHIWFLSRTSRNRSYIESHLIPEQDILESLLH